MPTTPTANTANTDTSSTTRAAPSRGGRPRAADGLTAIQRARQEVTAALAGRSCTVCNASATTARTPAGAPSLGALRGGGAPARRGEYLAALSDHRCAQHPLAGRQLAADGLTCDQRALKEIDSALAGRRCGECNAPATTALTPAGAPCLGALRGGDASARRGEYLAALSEYRCPAHPLAGRPRIHGDVTSVEHGRALVAAHLGGATCADPACTQAPVGGFTQPDLPSLGQVAAGERPHQAAQALAVAVVYCAPHLAARASVGVHPRTGRENDVAALGGPYAMVLALLGVDGIHQLATATQRESQWLLHTYARIGIGLSALFEYRRGMRRYWRPSRPLCIASRFNLPDSAAALADLDGALAHLAAATSTKDLTRRTRGGDSKGSIKCVTRNFAPLGIHLSDYWPQRLLDY